MVKKLITAALSVGMIAVSAMPAFAVQYSCANLTTGSTSNNICNTLLSKLHTFGLTNSSSTVNHAITQNSVSGNNAVNNNTVQTGNWSVNSGAAAVDVGSVAGLNTANVTVNQTDPSADHIGTNNNTGSTSNNTVNVTNDKTATVTVGNTGTVLHTINVNSVSGWNTVLMNTALGGGLFTGGATSNISAVTILNSLDHTVNH